MEPFTKVAIAYAAASGTMYCAVIVLDILLWIEFRRLFGPRTKPLHLDKESMSRWLAVKEEKFDTGFPRVVYILFVLFHFPGYLILTGIFNKESLNSLAMVLISAVVWLCLLHMLTT